MVLRMYWMIEQEQLWLCNEVNTHCPFKPQPSREIASVRSKIDSSPTCDHTHVDDALPALLLEIIPPSVAD